MSQANFRIAPLARPDFVERIFAARSAHLEAIGHFDRGLAVLASLPEKASRDRREVELQLARGLSLLTTKGFSSTEAVQSYARARDLCEKSGDSKQLFVALWNLWLTTAVRDIDAARPLSNQLLVLTKTGEHSALRLQAHHSAWFTRFIGGEPSAALSHCDEGRHLYNIDQHRSLASLYGGHDPGVCALHTGAFSTWLLGYPDKALASINGAVNLAERLGHPFSLAFALLYQVVLYLFHREPDVALRHAHEAEAFAVEQRLALLLDPNILRGKAFLAQEAVENALASVREGVAARRKPAGICISLTTWVSRQRCSEVQGITRAPRQHWLKPRWRLTPATSAGGKQKFIDLRVCCCYPRAMPLRANPASNDRSGLHESSKQARWNCVLRPALPGCGKTKAGEPKHVISSRPFMAGSPKASTPPT